MTACTLTPIWQLATLPSVPEYCRATHGEPFPSLGKPVSSITHAVGRTTSTARRPSLARTARVSQVEDVTGGSPRSVDTGRYAASSTLSTVCCS